MLAFRAFMAIAGLVVTLVAPVVPATAETAVNLTSPPGLSAEGWNPSRCQPSSVPTPDVVSVGAILAGDALPMGLRGCERGESNPHALSGTGT
jgi:hypothetical protein